MYVTQCMRWIRQGQYLGWFGWGLTDCRRVARVACNNLLAGITRAAQTGLMGLTGRQGWCGAVGRWHGGAGIDIGRDAGLRRHRLNGMLMRGWRRWLECGDGCVLCMGWSDLGWKFYGSRPRAREMLGCTLPTTPWEGLSRACPCPTKGI